MKNTTMTLKRSTVTLIVIAVLAKIRDINLPLISVTQAEPNSKDEANTKCSGENTLCSEQAKSEGGAYAD